ncbi:MAG TPA: WYL domain-containing protein [Planctomycetaceae bacterium]|nr:WYL domain-containing protein [Planctomycetaceae bacterium]HIQ21764.1 WYL domain-containing protein [Planctomycetota bacterium]
MLDPATRLRDACFVAFDLETTGLVPGPCRIVEFGATRFALEGRELASFQSLVDPETPIPGEATGIHGITNQMVRGQPPVAEVLPPFLDFLGARPAVLLAHNAPFDLGFLEYAVLETRTPCPDYDVIDTLELARRCLPGHMRYTLDELASRLGASHHEAHRALGDARRVAAVFRAIVARSPRLETVGDLCRTVTPQQIAVPLSRVPPHQACQLLRSAICESRTVVIVYQSRTGGRTERRITPKSLAASGRRLYLVAYCHTDGMEKTFRLDRIHDLRIEDP